jgi:hypothetical protein
MLFLQPFHKTMTGGTYSTKTYGAAKNVYIRVYIAAPHSFMAKYIPARTSAAPAHCTG